METKSNTKILIVEDDELNIRMVSSFLRDKYDIDAARSGEEALKKAIDNKYDIFLMDIGLKKEMNGLEVTNRLRKMSEYKNVPIIALTAYALSGDRERILNAGCSHYLSKPFSKNQLLNLLEKIVN
ncbi:MAG TPA: response regulator, partial [Ignavibacteriaceae bacterium]|nr:response regulator [Ignavibacteriaceae bacterium]HRQ55633.1 response regulator [Ignavibacteriaceae bacterium]